MGVTCEVTCFGVRRYRLDAPVAMLPLPLCAPSYRPPSHTETRERLGVPPDARCVLPTSGGWSLGPLARTAAELADAGAHVVTLGGSNTARNASCAWPRYRPRLHAFDWTDPVPELISAADLVVTSSGDTCSEARALGRRLLLLDVVQGHGRDNLQHELELGHADVVSARPTEVLHSALAALTRPEPHPSPGATPDGWRTGFAAALERVGLA
ncbi:glycosyltransferase [Kitasatospora purpeofusca]|uniref:glycosyltransferase n=1 Tax=Kitasatospora purpeofusca TaxID=67352 RepID=UPI003F4A9B01